MQGRKVLVSCSYHADLLLNTQASGQEEVGRAPSIFDISGWDLRLGWWKKKLPKFLPLLSALSQLESKCTKLKQERCILK
jgi:hypothetical protein